MAKKRSVQNRLIGTVAIFMLILIIAFCVIQSMAIEAMLSSYMQKDLEADIEACEKYISMQNGALDIDDQIFEYEDEDIFVFDREGALVYGNRYGALLSDTFEDDTLRKISYQDRDFYVYDSSYVVEDYGMIWIRGVNSTKLIQEVRHIYACIAVVLMGAFMLLCLAGIYRFVRRVFSPMVQIVDTANHIADSGDLHDRIALSGEENEFQYMADSFDKMLERIERSFEKEKQFTADASHELRTPISVIMSASEYALLQNNPEEYRPSMESIHAQALQMSKLVSQLLAISRMDQGIQKLQKEWFSFADVLYAVCDQAEQEAAKKNIRIECRLQEEILIYGDQTLIMRMAVNLIDNAIRYGRTDGYVRVTLVKEENTPVLTIEDNGIGIAKEQQEKIWERFYQIDAARTTNREGCGLGLYFVRWIAIQHDVEIRLLSELGKGSLFMLRFPTQK